MVENIDFNLQQGQEYITNHHVATVNGIWTLINNHL
jgi:hypothetical protein